MSDTAVEDVQEQAEDAVNGDQNGGANGSLAKKILIPAAAGVGTLAATMAAKKAPEVFRERVMPRLEERGADEAADIGKRAARDMEGQGGVMGAVAGKAREKLGGGGRRGETRKSPLHRR